jgi:hypothetical protein
VQDAGQAAVRLRTGEDRGAQSLTEVAERIRRLSEERSREL